MEKKLKISDILREKAIGTALSMSSEENQRDIPETPFTVSRDAYKTDGVLYLDKIEIEGNIFFIYQRM
ncbi:MAG: hypothetical protein UW95_C0024G0027 [Parcubacteria group bacterium GW2011_GWC1_45_14]|nr:MAG: hypothetical protein UW95_C0024G0027 [Parcubacteria group bacterium GW2011_GWC1_45_14]